MGYVLVTSVDVFDAAIASFARMFELKVAANWNRRT